MTDGNEGTLNTGGEAPNSSGTGSESPEVTALKSRNAGLDAKVTTLSDSQKAANARAVAAEQRLADYEAGKIGDDEALRARLTRAESDAATAKLEAKAARIEAKYPESFRELGDVVANMTDDKLAALEARLTGKTDSGSGSELPETDRPIGNNQARPVGNAPKAPGDMSIDELDAFIKAQDPELMKQGFSSQRWQPRQ
jgi:hypothetical protein